MGLSFFPCLPFHLYLPPTPPHPSIFDFSPLRLLLCHFPRSAKLQSVLHAGVGEIKTLYVCAHASALVACVCVCVWANEGLLGGVKREREIHLVPFSLSPHYKTVGFSERTDELQRVFHLKMELMPWLRLQITLQILITAAWQPGLNQWTLVCWTSSHSCLVSRCQQLTMPSPVKIKLVIVPVYAESSK